jgi:putative peptidoglycan lipid II flippase
VEDDHDQPSAQPGAHDSDDAAGERRRIRASTIIFSAATMLSRVAGLIREIATAAVFGATTTYSAFVVANQIPNLIRSLVADAALGASFVPVYTELEERGERERAWRVAGTVCSVILLVLGPLTVLAMIAAPWIVSPFLGATFSTEQVELTVSLARLLMPIVLVLALSGVTVGILNVHGRFGAAALAPGTLAGTVVQVVMPLPWLRGLGGRLRLRAAWRDPKVREVFVKMLPITLGIGLINLQLLISALLAAYVDANVGPGFSGLEPGAGPSILDKAFRIYMLPQGVFSVAVATVAFPALSRHVTRGDLSAFAAAVALGVRQILMLLVPSSVFIAVFAQPITRVLYERGAFDADQTTATAITLVALSLGLVFNGLSLLLIRSFFAMRQTWVPTIVSAVALACNVGIALAAYRTWGVAGIAAATSVANLLGVVLLYVLLERRTESLGTRRTVLVALGMLLASLVAVGLVAAAWRFAWEPWAGTGFVASLAGLAAALVVAAAIYLWLGARLRVVRPGMLRDLRRRPRA